MLTNSSAALLAALALDQKSASAATGAELLDVTNSSAALRALDEKSASAATGQSVWTRTNSLAACLLDASVLDQPL